MHVMASPLQRLEDNVAIEYCLPLAYAELVRGEIVSESQDNLSETQVATLDMSIDEISLPNTPVATEVETTFNSPQATKCSDVVHFSSNRTNTEEYSKLSSWAF